jgi:hypothetical protein
MIKTVLTPLLRRLGTAVAATLVTYNVSQEDAQLISTGLIAAALVGVDLLNSHVFQKKGWK